MAQTEGEKELVLGNKQLMSLFFVVVLLCGVFFALGYMLGRPRSTVANLDGNSTASSSDIPRSQDSDSPGANRSRAARESSEAPAAPTDSPDPPRSSVQTQPARDVPAPTPFPASASPANVAVPESGATYLQVTALHRADADNLVKTLREQNFPTLIAESSKPDLFRVLVGPYHQMAQVAEAKDRLKSLGFGNAFVQK